ncbi:hypothetical protein SMJ63A_110085 [Stenotrophomonas geniculata]
MVLDFKFPYCRRQIRVSVRGRHLPFAHFRDKVCDETLFARGRNINSR